MPEVVSPLRSRAAVAGRLVAQPVYTISQLDLTASSCPQFAHYGRRLVRGILDRLELSASCPVYPRGATVGADIPVRQLRAQLRTPCAKASGLRSRVSASARGGSPAPSGPP